MTRLWLWLFGPPYRLLHDYDGGFAIQCIWGQSLFKGCHLNFEKGYWTIYPEPGCWTDRKTARLWMRRLNA